MTPHSPASATATSIADRLATLAESWRGATDGHAPSSGSGRDLLREALNSIELEAEAEGLGPLAAALRRIAVLSEIWECLEGDPEQSDGAADVASFCVGALDRLARGQRTGRDNDRGVCEEILRQSAESWGEYISSLDPTAVEETNADQGSFDQVDGSLDDAPPEVDQATLLRLLQGMGVASAPPEPAHHTSKGASISEVGKEPPSPVGKSSKASTPPDKSTPIPSREQGRAASKNEPLPEAGLRIPPLPKRLDLDEEMREAFLADATDLFERIESIVVGLGSLANHREAIQELCRCFHTIKGAAGSVGLGELATLVHELEERLSKAGGTVSPGLNDLLHQVVNYLEELIGWLRQGGSAIPEKPPAQTIARVIQSVPPPATKVDAAVAPAVIPSASGAAQVPPSSQSGATSPVPAAEGPVRVPAARFDELTDLASELILQGRFWLSQAESMKTFATSVQDCRGRLLGSLDRLHDVGLWEKGQRAVVATQSEADIAVQLRRLEEQVDDLNVLAASAHAAAGPMADRGDTLVRLSRRIWDSFQSLRIVPIQGLFQRLARVLHDAARVEGRQVEVVMKGEETGVDRAVQDKAFEPLLHVVRNAVGHGIESAADRVQAGKSPVGRVSLEARREGNTLAIVVSDDGKGLDDEAIEAKARQLGWLGPHEKPSPERLHGFLFQSGFSTRSQANAISGRGVGMDVVAREVENLRGTIELTSQPGTGTQLTIRLPARLALEPALIMRVADQAFAIPASQVEHAQLFESPLSEGCEEVEAESPDPPSNASGPAHVNYRDQAVPVVFAREMLGIGQPYSLAWPKLVIVRAGSRLIGLVVDAIERAEDLVIKPLGALLAGHPLVSGTSTSINGEVISVLHSSGLERWLHFRMASRAHMVSSDEQAAFPVTAEESVAVLVVDDSISVRRGMARQLRGMGLKVQEVSDGLEALGKLRECHYGLVLTDLEMPKLDGFALLAEIKRSPRLATIPVIVASTRCDPETRRRVLELGAQALLSKPVDPHELGRTVEPFLPGIKGRRDPD